MTTSSSLGAKVLAEGLGTALLLSTIIGSGVMGERLAGGNEAIALLSNTMATGAILVVLITMLAPISGAHLNPAVTFAFLMRGQIGRREALLYIAAQFAGAIVGVLIAHAMFELPPIQLSVKGRTGAAQAFSEFVATFGLLTTILLTLRAKPDAVARSVGLYICAAYWFTASTSFANPAVTLARAFSDTFAGIRIADVPPFILAQLVGAITALLVVRLLVNRSSEWKVPDLTRPTAP